VQPLLICPNTNIIPPHPPFLLPTYYKPHTLSTTKLELFSFWNGTTPTRNHDHTRTITQPPCSLLAMNPLHPLPVFSHVRLMISTASSTAGYKPPAPSPCMFTRVRPKSSTSSSNLAGNPHLACTCKCCAHHLNCVITHMLKGDRAQLTRGTPEPCILHTNTNTTSHYPTPHNPP
jgi:hypothetical protein